MIYYVIDRINELVVAEYEDRDVAYAVVAENENLYVYADFD